MVYKRVLEEKTIINEYGVEYKAQLIEKYMKFKSTGTEQSLEFCVVEYIRGRQRGFKSFVRLGNAKRYIEKYKIFEKLGF